MFTELTGFEASCSAPGRGRNGDERVEAGVQTFSFICHKSAEISVVIRAQHTRSGGTEWTLIHGEVRKISAISERTPVIGVFGKKYHD